jgi:uridine kinase
VTDLAQAIADKIGALPVERPLVGFDGPDAAGKTTLADAVAARLSMPAVRASIDGFHLPAQVRTRRGSLSAEGYYRDSFDYAALIEQLLLPFGSGADHVTTQVFDYREDAPRRRTTRVPPRCALLFDGVFLLRPELREHWTHAVYLHVSEDETIARALRRDLALFGSEEVVVERYRRRYLPGQALYRREARPLDAAHLVVDNEDPAAPTILSRR